MFLISRNSMFLCHVLIVSNVQNVFFFMVQSIWHPISDKEDRESKKAFFILPGMDFSIQHLHIFPVVTQSSSRREAERVLLFD